MVTAPTGHGVPDPETRAEAAIWVARLHSDTRTAKDEAQFRAWLEEKSVNRFVFDRMTATWEAAGALNPLEVDLADPAPRPHRRNVLAGIGALVAAGGGFGVWSAAFAGVYETGIGERREVPLDDGSQLMLDTDTKVQVRIGSRSRHLSLRRGRVSLAVATDTARPFQIEAADRMIMAESGAIDVRRGGDAISVAVVKGGARVTPAGGNDGAGARRLTAGQRLIAPAAAPAHVDAPDLRQITAWQNGQAIFDGNMLAEAAAEMNRYSIEQIEIADPAVATLKISGVYLVGDTAAFADSVAAALPVRVQRQGTRLTLIKAPGAFQG